MYIFFLEETNIIRVSLWALLVILIDSATDFESTFQHFFALSIVIHLFVHDDWNLQQTKIN